MEEFAYFIIRLRRPAGKPDPWPVSGVIERLGSGEKRKFEAPEELIRLVETWSDPERNERKPS